MKSLAQRVLKIEADAIAAVSERLDERFDRAVRILFDCRGRVVLTGMGKSGLVARKIAATLSSTGTPALFLHPAEAVHGDLGMLVAGDAVVAISYSGETEELVRLLDWVKRLGTPLITMTGCVKSTLAGASEVVLDISVAAEACPLGLAPTASTTAATALGDALALALLECRGFGQEDYALLHPAGQLGRMLRRVEHVMKTGDAVPIVRVSTTMPDVIYEMSRKGLGVTAVIDDVGVVVGIISDGDLRRLLERRGADALKTSAAECMTRNPVTISRSALATEALQLLEARRITSVLVVDDSSHIEGIVHLHHLWGTQMI